MKTTLPFVFWLLSTVVNAANTTNILDWLHSINNHVEGGAWITSDAANNSYAAGSGDGFMYMTKRDVFGNFQWEISSTSGVGEIAVRDFVDPQGNPVLVGFQYSTLHEGPFAVALIVAKYDPAGNLIYKTIIPGVYTFFNNSYNRTNVTAQMDATGNVYIGTEGNVQGYPLTGFNAVKVSPSGKIVWVSTQPFTNAGGFWFVTNIRLFGDKLGLEGTTVYYAGNASTWVLDTTGVSKWSSTDPAIIGMDITKDGNGNWYVLASIYNGVSSTSTDDISIYKFSQKGKRIFVKSFDFGSYELAIRMEMTPDNNLAILGDGSQSHDLPYVDWLTLKVDLSGNLLWSRRYDKHNNNDEIPRMLAVDSKSNIYVTGSGGPFPGGSDLGALQGVTVRYKPNGSLAWTALVDTLGFSGVSIALGNSNDLFVLGASASAAVHYLQVSGTNPCSVPVNLITSNTTETTTTVQWDQVTNAFLYHLQYKTSLSNVWIQLSTDQNSYTLTGLTQGTSYDYRVQAICNSGETDFSPASHFSTAGKGYCGSKGLDASKEWIDLVLFGAISSSTGSDGGYADYTYLNTNVVPGSSQTITLSAGMDIALYTESWKVWIDFNADGDFDDPGEEVVSYKSSQIGWEDHSFTIPSNAVLGTTRMRVSMKHGSQAQLPCDVFSKGEVEDYNINIVAARNINSIKEQRMVIYPNPGRNNITIQFPHPEKHMIEIVNLEGQTVLSRQFFETEKASIDVSSLNAGIYTIRSVDENGYVSSIQWVKQ